LKKTDEAVQLLRRAVAIGEEILSSQPAKRSRYLVDLIQHLFFLASAMQIAHKDPAEIIPILEQAAKLSDELCDQFPDVPEYFAQSHSAHLDLMFLYKDAEDLDKAIIHGQKLVEVHRILIDKFPALGERTGGQEQLQSELAVLTELRAKANRPAESRPTE
jgi:tetratricopeptide (TPR) repeat protein